MNNNTSPNQPLIHWKNGQPPQPPYYANVFNYLLGDDLAGYDEMDAKTLELVWNVDGFLGYESHKSSGRGSFISYWRDLEAINQWRHNPIHQQAKSLGQKKWYKYYHSMLVLVQTHHYHSFSSL
ncbi:MAG: hypothetical protein Kow0075_05350 [Salibacteraceae bacterium]